MHHVKTFGSSKPLQVGKATNPKAGKGKIKMYSSRREFEARILVKGVPVKEVVHNDSTYIEGRNNSEYEIQFINRMYQTILVIPSVDGLSVLNSEPCGKNSPGYVLGPKQTLTIPGWKVDNGTAAKFVFRPQGETKIGKQTYVEALDENSENQGVIGFMIFKEKPKVTRLSASGYQPVSYSLSNPSWGLRGMSSNSNLSNDTQYVSDWNNVPDAVASLGTGFGDATEFNTTKTTFEKATEEPYEVMVFQYDSLSGLKKRGVPTHLFKTTAYANGPNPFPASPEVTQQGCRIPNGWKKFS